MKYKDVLHKQRIENTLKVGGCLFKRVQSVLKEYYSDPNYCFHVDSRRHI